MVAFFSILFVTNRAHAASVLVQQTDGSISAGIGGRSGGAADQVFTPTISSPLGAIELFTANFGTASANPDTNGCGLSLFDDETGAFLASADNGFSGFRCAGDLVYTFQNSQPFLQAGHRYRWEFSISGFFAGVSIFGSPNDTVGGAFSVPPVVNAKFTAFATIAAPASLTQIGDTVPIPDRAVTNASNITLGAMLPSALPDSLQLQVELEPSYIPFKNVPNLVSAFVNSGTAASVSTSTLPISGYHWQARSADALGHVSFWQTIANPPSTADFLVHNPSSNIVLQDSVTGYGIGTTPNPCFGDGSVFSCALAPSFNNYLVAAPFPIAKITFDWHNGGGNNCDGIGNYGAVITSASTTNSIIATSTNTIYMGCAGFGSGTGGAGELDFTGQIVPASFYLTFGAFDGALQGGSGISVSNVTVYAASTFGTISVSTNNAAATFTLSDGAGNNFSGRGAAFSHTAPPGAYTITFGALSGFTTPDSQTKMLSSGGSVSFTGNYQLLIAPPTNLHATVGNGTITLDWNPSQTPNIDGYNIYLEQFIGDHFVSFGTMNAVGVPIPSPHFVVAGQFSDGTITNSTLYRLHVTAVKAGFESVPSDFALARPAQFALSQLPPPPKTPVLFLHGICLLSTDTNGAEYWKETRDFLANDLHWMDGGTLKYLSGEDPRELPPQTENFVPGASFYTATFGNCKANYFVENPLTGQRTYFGRPGVLHQADEVQGFIRTLNASGAEKVNIVAHSMGGLAARSYVADNALEAANKIMTFVTYGTPHWGVPSVFLLSSFIDVKADGARDLTVDCDFNPIGLTSTLNYSSSAFLEHLRQSVLSDQIRYVNIRGQAFFDISHLSDLSGCLSPFSDGVAFQFGPIDISSPLIPIDSADLVIPAHAPINQPAIIQKRTMITTDHSHTSQPSDFSAILCALDLNCVIYRTHSPVDIEITAPDGRMITRQLTEIPGASYMEILEESGATSAIVLLPFPLEGEYSIKVIPKPSAAPADSYGLDVTRAGITTVLAQDQSIQAIPSKPYAVDVLRPVTIDIKPGNSNNKIQIREEGKIRVAILSTAGFKASARVDTSTLTFGHFGDEHSLAFCEEPDEDFNGDGLPDLVCHFLMNKTGFVPTDNVGVLKGQTKEGIPFVGTDTILFLTR